MSSEDKGKLSQKRDRYWSVMLVGDHGRVIPFRHFKGLAIGVCVGFILMLIAVVVMALLYTHQAKKMATLIARISEVQKQNSKLRDEKDLYLTRLMLKEKKQAVISEKSTAPAPTQNPPEKPAEIKEVPPQKAKKPEPKPEKPTPAAKPAAIIKWNADIRNFAVSYDARQEMLKAQFRIYNTSRPKKPLSGRSVIVFKNLDDPPIKWLTVPQVQLEEGKPPATKGQPFQIRNYFTMRFRAYRQKAPIQYNAVTAYVFSNDGKLLASKEMAVKIDVPLPKKEAPPKAPPVVEKKPEPPVQEAIESTDGTTQTGPAATPPPAQIVPATDPDVQLPAPEAAPSESEQTPGKETAPTGQMPEEQTGETPNNSTPIKPPSSGAEKDSLPSPTPPETEPKP